MSALGYEALGEFGLPGRRYFRKGDNPRTHQVHVFQEGDVQVGRHLAFRDYLVAHPAEAAAYGELKARLAARFAGDYEAYMDGFIKETERRALCWYRENGTGKRVRQAGTE